MYDYLEKVEKYLDHKSTWLITGVAGFIGSNLLEALLILNQNVVGIDNFETGFRKNIDEAINDATNYCKKNNRMLGQFTFIEGDIRNIEDCKKATKNVNFILHQAALGSVPRSIEDPARTNSTNISGFLNMLIAARDNEVDKFIYAASSSTYGDHPKLPKEEEIIGNPLSPYAVTKLVNELYADVFKRIYNLDSIGLRYFNIFGKRQNPNGAYAAVIPQWINSLINNESVFINGDGETSRDFCYIENAIQMNLLAAISNEAETLNKVYNVAVGDRTSLNELFSLIIAELEKNNFTNLNSNPIYRDFRPGDVKHSLADITRATKSLKYIPSHKICDGLSESISWYIQNNKSK